MLQRVTIWLFLLAGLAHGQVVQITGTVLDPNNVPYQNGSGVAVLVPQNQTWIINGTNPVPSPIPIAQLDSFGKFSISLTNTSLITPSSASPQWQFSFCSSKAVINPPICFTMTPMALTSSQDISTQIQAQSAVLPSSSSGLSSLTTTSPLTGCSSPCTSTATIGISNATTSALGVIELAGDFGGSATLPDVLNLSNVTNASLANSGLVHPSVTVTAGTGLTGGGTVALGGSITLNSTGGGGNPQLENCTPDETGNSFYNVTSLTNYFNASWQFVFNTTTYINCTVYIPAAQAGATVAVDVWSSDSTAGHTASITYADGVINSGTMNTGSLTSASNQTFTTTSTANNRVTLTFSVQSTLSNGSILVVKIGTAPTGTAPTANLNIYAHFIL